MITRVNVEDAVGMVLAHDITKIIPGKFKGPAFRRGHVITENDIPELLNIGKEHVFILTLNEGEVHEEDAALRIASAVSGRGLTPTAPREGRVDLKASLSGLLKINVPLLEQINTEDVMVVTLHNNSVLTEGTTVAGMRIIPLYIREEKLAQLEKVCREKGPVIEVIPIPSRKVGVIVTGSEVSKGRITDQFGTIVEARVNKLGSQVVAKAVVTDDADLIAKAMIDLRDKGCEVIMACSGMSVDPDDMTPEGIRRSGAEVKFYGVPVLPGNMFLYARLGDITVLGIPACVLHAPTTVFDLLVPRILAGEIIRAEEIRKMAHGGLCLKHKDCVYPMCPFGK